MPGCNPEPALEQGNDERPVIEEADMTLTVTSTAFQSGQSVPKQHTGDGADTSPLLAWSGAPAGTQEFALICDDPDAPSAQPWVHWVIYGIPADVAALPEGIPPAQRVAFPVAALQGKNSWPSGKTVGYRGPAPPPGHGVHHYHFKVYALNAKLNLAPGLTKEQLLSAMQGHIVATGELVGTYSR
jgi:Raf kinase inhibitor-like YbhB/YbcL family protein